jgi:hypothetical protein
MKDLNTNKKYKPKLPPTQKKAIQKITPVKMVAPTFQRLGRQNYNNFLT